MVTTSDRWTIAAGDCTLTVAAHGAETIDVRCGGRAWLWRPRPDVWNSVSPLLFPVIGRLRHGGLTIAGRFHPLDAHGFARRRIFEQVALESASVTLVDRDDAETRAIWPFAYRLQVTHRVMPYGFSSEFLVKNCGDDTMGFSLGAHPGFALPVISRPGWTVHFSDEGCAGPYPTRDRLLDLSPARLRGSFAITGEAFRDGAVYFGDAAGKTVSVTSPEGTTEISIRLGRQPWLALWSAPSADLLCLEPLAGTTDTSDASGRIGDKHGLVWLEPGQSWSTMYEVLFPAMLDR